MKSCRLRLLEYRIPLISPLTNAIGSVTERQGIILKGETEDGNVCLGEAAPYPGLSRESIDEVSKTALLIRDKLTGKPLPTTPDALEAYLQEMNSETHLPPSLYFGVETMLADLASQQSGQPLFHWFNAESADSVALNALLPSDLSQWPEFVQDKRKEGFSTFKMKVGVRSVSDDIESVKELSQLLNSNESIRLDANRSFSYRDAVEFLTTIRDDAIAYIEEPLVTQDLVRLPELRAETGIKIAVDESVVDTDLFFRLLESGCIDVVVLKPTMVGGIARCLRLAKRARSHGADVVVTSLLESGIGVAAGLHLAAILENEVLPCGLDTLGYLEDSLLSEPLKVTGGRMMIPDLPGIGVKLSDSVASCTKELGP